MGAISVKPFQYKQSKLIIIITQLTASGASKSLFAGVRNTCTLYYYISKAKQLSHLHFRGEEREKEGSWTQ